MQELSPSTRVELDVQGLLISQASLDSIAEKLINLYGNTSMHQDEIEAFAFFLFQAGLFSKLTQFLISCAGKGMKIPWGLLCEGLFRSSPAIPQEIKMAVIAGAEEQDKLFDLARSDKLDHFDERLAEIRKGRTAQLQKKYEQQKADLLSALETLRTQGLHEEESLLLEKIKKIFPGDLEVVNLLKKRAQLKALNLLYEVRPTRPSWIPLDLYEKKDLETILILKNIEKSMQDFLAQERNKDLATSFNKDFAIANIMFEAYEASLSFLDPLSPNKDIQWLRMEILLLNRKFVELLSELQELERRWTSDPEATFSILYLRAQAYWGLNQKHLAIEIMQSISIARPDYRSSNSLLAEWKQDLA